MSGTPERNGRVTDGGTTAEPLLEVRDLSIVYDEDVMAVDHVSLELGRGETVGLAGESGCGKSTLALGLCRLLRPPAVITSGSVVYRGSRLAAGGVDLMEQSSRELRKLRWREISVVFQSAMNSLNPVLRVRDQLGDAIDAHLKLGRREKQDRLGELLDLVGIPRERLRSYPHELSGGMRQRVVIAMALAAEPEVVIMDEPTTALDVVVQKEILAQVVELQQRLNFAVLFITHDLSLLIEIADRIAVMYAGRIVEIGTAEKIHNQASHPYTQGLLGSFPSVHGARRELAGIPGSPPDLRALPPGCPFVPRCAHAREQCREIDMSLGRVNDADASHLTACPFVRPRTAGDWSPTARTAEAGPAR
ncbi:MAG TPA: ABC transporter ATP-binding protein [Solirubrobacteraceae bacterium]|nr:ABC transporter ATP-binding protein [Solirubrobacteraceae bacterium]